VTRFPDGLSRIRPLTLAVLTFLPTTGLGSCREDMGREDASILEPVRFEVTGIDVPVEAGPALDEAMTRWSRFVASEVPVRVRVTFVEGGPAGFAVPNVVRDFEGAPIPDTWYPSALADALAGRDLQPDQPDFELFFRRDRKWKFAIDGEPTDGEADFLTVAMHEVAHGLGMAGWLYTEKGVGYYGREVPFLSFVPQSIELPDLGARPMIFVRWIEDAAGRRLTDTTYYPNPSPELGGLLERDRIYFAGPAARRANGGRPPRLYGASPSHLHPDDYFWTGPDYLMTPTAGNGVSTADPGPILLGILEDIGWQVVRNP
jgi:hypothetical protein